MKLSFAEWLMLAIFVLILLVSAVIFFSDPGAATLPDTAEPEIQSDPSPFEKIDINTANALRLSLLPGIDTDTAEKIVSYRRENGYFVRIEDLLKVPGIDRKTFEGIEQLIYASDIY